MDGPGASRILSTVTHARLRFAQGDVPGARRIVEAILAADPVHAEARTLLATLGDSPATIFREPDEETPAPPEAGDPRELAAGFRRLLSDGAARRARTVKRMAAWVEVLGRNRGRIRVR